MNTMITKNRTISVLPQRLFFLCPGRHICMFAGVLIICAHFLLRNNRALMNYLTGKLVHPYHQLAASFCSIFPFSVAELLCLAFFLAVGIYLIRGIVLICTRRDRLPRLYVTLITLASSAAVIYGGFCLLWGIYYYSDNLETLSGISSDKISVEQLEAVTEYFANIANEYSDDVPRDNSGIFSEDKDELFERSKTIYNHISTEYSFLSGPELKPKSLYVSKFMSYINFTGFFFPFTGEANLNVDVPVCLLPSTIAHEQAHQRGVAAEQEANFAAVLSCMECGDSSFTYSGALLAYIHLGNALHSADNEAWERVFSSLNESVLTDLYAHNDYWAQFETKAADVSEELYEGFLQSYGQELGMKSYGACVDLLVNYYYDAAVGGVK